MSKKLVSVDNLISLFSQEENRFSDNLEGNISKIKSELKLNISKSNKDEASLFSAEDVKNIHESGSIDLLAKLGSYFSEESSNNSFDNYTKSRSSAPTAVSKNSNFVNVNMNEGFRGFRDVSETVGSFSEESFAPSNIGKMRADMFSYNLRASVQDDYNRELWRLRMVSPGEKGVTYTVPKLTVRREQRVGVDYTTSIYDRQRNVWDAVQDPTILEGDFLSLYPVLPASGTATTYFPTNTYGRRNVDVLGTEVTTGPLLAKDASGNAASVNFLALARTNIPGQITGIEGYDSISPGAALSKLYFAGNVTVGSTPTAMVFSINTLGMHRSSYNQAQEGSSKEATLDFSDTEIRIKLPTIKNITNNTSVDVAAFTASGLEEAEVVLGINATSTLNLESGMLLAPVVTTVKVKKLVIPSNVIGTPPKVITAVGQASAGAQTLAWTSLNEMFVIDNYQSFELASRATNNSHRENGLIIEDRKTRMNYYVLPRTPLCIASEASGNSDVSETLPIATASELVRIRRNNDGVKQMFELSDHFSRVIGSVSEGSVNGMRYPSAVSSDIIAPYYYRDEFDVLGNYSNIQSANRDNDVSGALISYLKIIATDMVRNSHYTSTLKQQFPGEKPRVVLATDPTTASYLVRSGDVRLFGDFLDVVVVSTDVKAHYGRIMMSLARENRADGDLYSSGECVVAPDFISVITPATDGGSRGAYAKLSKVQPAYVFVPVLPVLCDITIVNLSEALAQSSVVKTEEQV